MGIRETDANVLYISGRDQRNKERFLPRVSEIMRLSDANSERRSKQRYHVAEVESATPNRTRITIFHEPAED